MQVDFTRLALLARVASAAYENGTLAAEKLFEALGMQFVTILGNGQCYVTIARWGERLVFAVRGTQVMTGFSLSQLLDNERVGPIYTNDGIVATLPGAAMDGYFTPLAALYDSELHKFVDGGPLEVVGHSMGGVRSLLMAALLPREHDVTVTAFAPPKGATKGFWNAAYEGRRAPLLVGRRDDFALNHAIAASALYGYCQPDAIFDMGADGAPRFVTEWPIVDESIADHDVEKYVADCAALALNPPAMIDGVAA